MRKVVFLAMVSLACLTGQAHAQRCLPKMKGIELRGGMADGFYTEELKNEAGYYFGAALSSYTKGGNKWVYGVEYLQRHKPYRVLRLPVSQFTAEGGFYYNFLSDKRKIMFLYIGGSALAGYETVNWGEKLLYDGSRLNTRDAFIYGCAAPWAQEGDLAAGMALTASVRERFLWGGSTGHFHTQYGAGIKFIIN